MANYWMLPMLLAAAAAAESPLAAYEPLEKFHAKMAQLETEIEQSGTLEMSEERRNMLQERLESFTHLSVEANENIMSINGRAGLINDLYEGDLILSKDQLDELVLNETTRARRQASKPKHFPANIWGPNTPIPFSIDAKFTAEVAKVLRDGMKYWSDRTCVRFKEGAEGKARIKFVTHLGCSSCVGKIGNEQPVSIGSGCDTLGIVTHELGHTIGLYHTQSRHDRDQFVIVNTANIDENVLYNFDKQSSETSDNYGIPYEYGSNMHYDPFGFAKDYTKPTIVAIDKEYQHSMVGDLPTFYDILLVNKYYNCFETMCKGVLVSCKNNGVQDVNNCRKCLCPTGYAGDDCGTLDPKYEVIAASATRASKYITLGNKKHEIADTIAEKLLLIQAPAGRRVELIISNLEMAYPTGDCMFGSILVWKKKDTRMNGLRACRRQELADSYVSDTENLIVRVWNQFAYTSANLTYRIV